MVVNTGIQLFLKILPTTGVFGKSLITSSISQVGITECVQYPNQSIVGFEAIVNDGAKHVGKHFPSDWGNAINGSFFIRHDMEQVGYDFLQDLFEHQEPRHKRPEGGPLKILLYPLYSLSFFNEV